MSFFPFSANWRDSYHVVYEFKTDVFTSRSGREQRRALRTTPRKQLQFTVTLESGAALNRFVYRNQNATITIVDRSRHVRAVSVNGSQIELNILPHWIFPSALIGIAGSQYSVVDVVDSFATVAESLVSVVPGTAIFPIVTARMSDTFSLKNVSEKVVEAAVSLAIEPGGPDSIADIAETSQEVFNGREVFLFDPNWANPIDGQFSRTTDMVDFARGLTQVYTPINFGARVKQISVLFPTQQDRTDAVSFVHRMKGQRGEFYMPTWEDDLCVTRIAPVDTTTLWVSGNDTFESYVKDTVYKAVVLQDAQGNQFYRRIVMLASDGVDTALHTDVPWPIDIDNSVKVSWLLATRLATDTFDMECVTDEVGRSQFNTRTLEDLPVPDIANPWAGLDEGAQWLIDYYGWRNADRYLLSPVHEFVHVDYPSTAASAVFGTGTWWLNQFYGQPYATVEIAEPLHRLVHQILPES